MAKQTYIFTSEQIGLFDHVPAAGKTVEPQPDPPAVETEKDGITYERVERLIIGLADKVLGSCRLEIRVACGDSGNWYNAYHFYYCDRGISYYPYPGFSEKYPDRATAIERACDLVYKKAVEMIEDAKLVGKIAVALTDFLLVALNPPSSEPGPIPAQPDQTVIECENDTICRDWRSCQYGDACMDDRNINIECACFMDEPHRIPVNAFSRDELKVIAARFNLVKYSREEKMIWRSEIDQANNHKLWVALEPFATYAAAERQLKALKDSGHIETGFTGKILITGWNRPGSLLEAGFEFYRYRGDSPHEQTCCIMIGSKNWSYLAKYPDMEALQTAWGELMQTEKALEG